MHISNDVPGFTVDYLSDSPFRSREPYIKMAPISRSARARTPMLIQRGSEDRRVPLSNAMELYRVKGYESCLKQANSTGGRERTG